MAALDLYGLIQLPLVALAGTLLLFHLWYDFHVQGSFISAGKRTSNLLLSVHATTWVLFVSVPLYLVGTLTVEQFAFLFVTHWLMDWTKGHKLPPGNRSLVIDQMVHVLTLAACLWKW